jgi:hypothetical protein
MRLRAAYEDEEDEEDERQRIRIEPIFDADSCVFFDLDAKRQDKSDAQYCFVLSSMTKDLYTETYGDDSTTWPKDIGAAGFDWSTPDVIYVAEYYAVEKKSDTLLVYKTVAGDEEKYWKSEFDADPTMEPQLAAVGSVQIRTKQIKRTRIHKYIMSGGGVLEDSGYIAGKCLPIIPVYGKRWYVDSVERCMGHVRLAMDAQRLKNMQLSKLAEIAAFSPVEKPIVTPEQIAGHTLMWEEDNIKDYPYLLLNPHLNSDGSIATMAPVGYTKAPEIPPAMAALLQITETDMKEILGGHEQADKVVSNISAKAIELIQTRIDLPTFIYLSNFAKALKRVGEVWLSMAKDVYVEPGRKLKTLDEQKKPTPIELLRKIQDPKTGELTYENDLSRASFDVTVDIGPTSSTRRDAMVRTISQLLGLTDDAETKQVLMSMILHNLEGEGLSDIRQFYRHKLVMLGVLKPTDEEAAQMAATAQQEDPNAVFLRAAADQATAKATGARVDVAKTMAEVENLRADTMDKLAAIDERQQQQIIDNFVALLGAKMKATAAPPQPAPQGMPQPVAAGSQMSMPGGNGNPMQMPSGGNGR